MVETMIEFSAAGLVVRLVEDRVHTPFAVKHPSMDPSKPLGAFSTGPKFGPEFPTFLKVRFGGDMENSKQGHGLWDARCRVPAHLMSEFVQWFCDAEMTQPGNGLIDFNPYPELRRRLSKPYWQGVDPPLTEAEAKAIQLIPIRFVRQPPTAAGKVRLFKLYRMVQPTDLLGRLSWGKQGLDGVAVKLSTGDLNTTEGGSKQGKFGITIEEGPPEKISCKFELSDNLGLCLGNQDWRP